MLWQIIAASPSAARERVIDAAKEKGCTECGLPAVVAVIEPALVGGVKASAWCHRCAGGAES